MVLDYALFAIMALIWGSTWIAIKFGIATVPPITFAAARYVLVAITLLLLVPGAAKLLGRNPHRRRIIVTGLLTNAATYGLLFWGMQRVPSGVSGVVNLSLIVVGLFALAILFGDERPTWRHAGALIVGVTGLVILFWGKLDATSSGAEIWSLGAIVAGTFAYCLGSVLARPILVAGVSPLQLTGAQAAVGAAALALGAAWIERPGPSTLGHLLAPAPLAGLAFLVVLGTFVAYTIYLRLVHAWGAPRAGLYAFVSPVIALLLGAAVFGETLGLREAGGAALMLAAAFLAMRRAEQAAG